MNRQYGNGSWKQIEGKCGTVTPTYCVLRWGQFGDFLERKKNMLSIAKVQHMHIVHTETVQCVWAKASVSVAI